MSVEYVLMSVAIQFNMLSVVLLNVVAPQSKLFTDILVKTKTMSLDEKVLKSGANDLKRFKMIFLLRLVVLLCKN